MNKSHRILALLAACLVLFGSVPARAAGDFTSLARQGVDQVINLEMNPARETFRRLRQQYPNYPFALFLEATVDWAEAEASEGGKRDQLRDRAIRLMIAAADRVDRELENGTVENVDQWRLTRGMANFFAARMYADKGHSIKAYRLGRAGRDELRELIEKQPDMYDAYLVLGMYEYIAGSIPRGLRWLAALFDLSGDRDKGVRYLEKASANASIMAPEAARMLLVAAAILPETTRGCAYMPMAKYTRKQYPDNPHYSVALQLMYVNCGYPAKAIAETAIAEKQFLERFPNLAEEFRVIRIYAYRDQGRVSDIQQMKGDFNRDQAYWKLIMAQTYDVVGERSKALELYNDIFWADVRGEEIQTDSGPPVDWIVDRVARYRKDAYKPADPKARITGDYLYLESQKNSNRTASLSSSKD